MEDDKAEEKESGIKLKQAHLEKLIKEHAEQGNSPAKIGSILRDKHNFPKTRLLGKKITRIIHDLKLKPKTEIEIIKEKVENLKSHIEKNKHDKTAPRALSKKLWLLHTLEKNN